jgi:hypothetical protein
MLPLGGIMSETHSLPPTTEPLDEVSGRALVEAWRASGLNGTSFCRAHGVRVQRLHYWRERLGYPIKIVGDPRRPAAARVEAPPPTEGFVQMVVSGPSASVSAAVDIVVGDVLVRVQAGFDAALVRSVVAALRGEG